MVERSSRLSRSVGARAVAVIALIAVLGTACDPVPSPTSSPSASGAAATATLGAANRSPTPAPTPAPARWTDCGNGFECATLTVPRDYEHPGPARVNLALIRLRATGVAKRVGSLVVNPGGPGGSGVDFVREHSDAFAALRKRFDIVGFDPRGVNQSTPIRCLDTLDHFVATDPTPDTPAEHKELVAIAREFVAGCEKRDQELLPFLSTANVARDLDVIRASLREEKLTYLGFSYGTLIGATYAEMFPDRVRALVLDGAVDPSLDLDAFRSAQAAAFEGSLDRFLADCARRPSCIFHHGGRSASTFEALMRRIEAKALPVKLFYDPRDVGPGLAWSAVLGALYSPAAWEDLAFALEAAERGDGSFLLLISDPFRGRRKDGSYSNMIDAYTATTCLDFPASRKVADYDALAARLARTAPHFGPITAYNDLTCAFWPVSAEREPAPLRASGAPPIVVVGSTGDPATPYAWSKALASQLESGVLITRKGEGHTAYLFSACISRVVDAYLIDLKVPKDRLVCE